MRNLKHFIKLAGCLACLQSAFILQGYAQNQYVYSGVSAKTNHNFSAGGEISKKTLLSVLKELNRDKGVYFLYSEETVGNKMVNPVPKNSTDIEKILAEVL
ncbi:MAG TPA: hypothetical protein VGO09_11580, partial [Flavisolibacter sp.]|nr:hypothetical protein [Flavisolibacter sp.]